MHTLIIIVKYVQLIHCQLSARESATENKVSGRRELHRAPSQLESIESQTVTV